MASKGGFGLLLRRHVIGVRWALQLVALAAAAGLVLTWLPPSVFAVEAGLGTQVVLLSCLIGATLLRLVVMERILRRLGESFESLKGDRYENETIPEAEVDGLAERYWYSYAEAQNGSSFELLSALTRPEAFARRVSEHRQMQVGRWDVRVSRLVDVPASLSFFPVMKYAKGSVLGKFRVEVDGRRAYTLNYDQSKGALIDALYTLWPAALSSNNDELLQQILRICAADVPPTGEEYSAITEDVQVALGNSPSAGQARTLKVLVHLALTVDCVFVGLPETTEKGKRLLRVEVEYEDLRPRVLTSPKNRFRALLGMGHRSFTLPLGHLAEARSYHLDVVGPAGMYLYSLEPHAIDPELVRNKRRQTSEVRRRFPTVSVSERVGDEIGHLYARDFDGIPTSDSKGVSPSSEALRVRAEFRELPPGILGPIAMVAVWVTALVWIVGWNFDLIFGASSSSGSWPAVIFGVPAIVTGLILSRLTKETVRILSVPVFFCAMWLTLNAAVTVVVVAFLTIRPGSTWSQDLGLGFGPSISTEQFPWFLLMMSTFGLSFVSSALLATKAIVHANVVNGTD